MKGRGKKGFKGLVGASEEKGHEIKCDFIGRDGYFETARIAVETATWYEILYYDTSIEAVCRSTC